MLSVLPHEMNQIRNREEVMLDKEHISKEKKNQSDVLRCKRDFVTVDATKGLEEKKIKVMCRHVKGTLLLLMPLKVLMFTFQWWKVLI